MPNRLELTWVGKETRPRVEPRILLEDPAKSYHAKAKVTQDDFFDNRLVFGDNLLALRSLEQEFAGSIQCIYIDPPFNTQQAFEHYEDTLEHSLWLTMMRDRLEVLRRLLSNTGSVWVHLDDSELHRARCIMDEVYGPQNFVGTIIWEKSDSPRMDVEYFSSRHDYILVYARELADLHFNRLRVEGGVAAHYDKTDERGRRYYLKPLRAMGGQGDSRAARPNLYFALLAPDGSKIFPKRQDGSDGAWRWSPEKCEDEKERIDWIQGRTGWAPYFRIYADEDARRPPETIWTHEEVGSNRTSKAEVKKVLPGVTPFATPKPEALLGRILEIAYQPGDWVLDSFAGSGTTGAVAHKMGRCWIMVELGDHCHTHIIPRLTKVINGTDEGGITGSVYWKGGGGFRYYKLAPSLLSKDEFGNWVVNRQYNAAMLAEAVCKLEGFRYSPSSEVYWQQGYSSEDSFIYVTTQTLLVEQLRHLNEEVGPRRSLLICCGSFAAKNLSDFPQLTVKKIPKAVLHRCEWGHDDYSLEIRSMPAAPTSGTISKSADDRGTKGSRRRTVTLLSYGES